MSSSRFDAVVVGAGIVGLATARELLLRSPGRSLAVLEKEPEIAAHQSGHNSGVLHAGLYYRPGSFKARLCRDGKALLEAYAEERGIPFERCGKLVVALDESELGRLEELKRRGTANGIRGLRELGPAEIRELEPNIAGVRALHVPETGVIDFREVAAAYADDVRAAGGEIRLGTEVRKIERRGGRCVVTTGAGELEAALLVSCAGLHSDRVAALDGLRRRAPRLVPFRGDYYTFKPDARALVNGLVYPVPDPSFPFLGVHFTKTVRGEVLAGPNAVLALAREGYRRTDVNLRDLAETLAYPGVWRLARKHYRAGAAEVWRDLVKRAFVRDMQRYLPAIRGEDVEFGPSGVRGQFLSVDGTLLDDFVIETGADAVHVLNAPSPAATSSLAIARYLADAVEQRAP